MAHFRINQFLITSDLSLPAAPCCRREAGVPDDRLSLCHEAGTLNEFSQVRWMGKRGGGFLRSYDAGDGALVCASDGFKMHVDKDGRKITLDFDESNNDHAKIARALSTNLGMSISTLFRGEVPLHGAGVEIDGQFIGLMAPSGAGKSTMLWSLLDHGARFGNDDVIPVHVAEGRVMATPSMSLHAKLSRAALENRGLEPLRFEEWVPGSNEFWVPMNMDTRVQEPHPLAALFVLRPVFGAESPDQIRVHRAEGEAALSLLMENTQGLWAVSQMVDGKRLFSRYADVARAVPMYVIEYHKCLEALPALMNTMRDLLHLRAGRAKDAAKL